FQVSDAAVSPPVYRLKIASVQTSNMLIILTVNRSIFSRASIKSGQSAKVWPERIIANLM
ncbi:MAG: hypothetical protein KAR12_13045, partial [Methylococcales bacterium]|nr:hypothetical protein [Methylococcales bacterium]